MRVTPIQSQAYNFKSQEINPTQENISIPEEVPAEIEATTLPEPLTAAENKTASTANVLLGLGLLASLGVAGAALYKNKNIKKEITSLKDKLSNSEKATEELKTKLKEAEAKATKTNEIKSDNKAQKAKEKVTGTNKANTQKNVKNNSNKKTDSSAANNRENARIKQENRKLSEEISKLKILLVQTQKAAKKQIDSVMGHVQKILAQNKILKKNKPLKQGEPLVIKPKPKKSLKQKIKDKFTPKKGIVINKQHKIRPLSDEVEKYYLNLRELVKRNRKTNQKNA